MIERPRRFVIQDEIKGAWQSKWRIGDYIRRAMEQCEGKPRRILEVWKQGDYKDKRFPNGKIVCVNRENGMEPLTENILLPEDP